MAAQALLGPVMLEQLDRAGELADQLLAQSRSRGSVVGLVIAGCMHAAVGARRGELVGAETDVRTVVEIAVEYGIAFAIPSALWYGADALIERPGLADIAALADIAGLPPDFARTASGALLREVRGRLALAAGSGARLEHARALVELGAALRRANQRTAARGPLRAGLDLAYRCGATRLTERARDELLAAGARPRRGALTGLEALTTSERRVAELAATGMSNPEVAQALFVTLNTVEGHLRHAADVHRAARRGAARCDHLGGWDLEVAWSRPGDLGADRELAPCRSYDACHRNAIMAPSGW